MKRLTSILFLGLIISLYHLSFGQLGLNVESQGHEALTNIKSRPLVFTENRGQWNEKAHFKAEASGACFWFCGNEVTYVFTRNTRDLLDDGIPHNLNLRSLPNEFNRPRFKKESIALHVKFIGANLNCEIIPEDRLSYNSNYFLGNNPSNWATDVPSYSSVVYKDIYPGIDLKYYGDGKGMKYDFIIQPNAEISRIRIKYEGVENLAVSNDGDLEARTDFGPIHEKSPYIYQQINQAKHSVSGSYELKADNTFGFQIDDNFNPNYPLIIDPSIVFSTYLGGSGYDSPSDMKVDADGFLYTVGTTPSEDFPMLNPYDGTHNGYDDFYVTKFAQSGSALIYSTFIGGNSQDYSGRMALDSAGNVFISGYTISTDFPTVNPYQIHHSQNWEGIVLKLSAAGDRLLYSTYFGGSDGTQCYCIKADNRGDSYITGMTQSIDLPTNPGAYDRTYNGSDQGDAFLAKFSESGNTLLYCTYLGSPGADMGYRVDIDSNYCPIVAGITDSQGFPTWQAYDSSFNGTYDVFVTKFNPSATGLIFSTFLGGSSGETPQGMRIGIDGSIYLAGETFSTNFPMVNSFQNTPGGEYDAYVAVLSSEGSGLLYSTYLGGGDWEMAGDVAVSPVGEIIVTGYTQSPDFPLLNQVDDTLGWQDAFVTIFNHTGNEILFSSFLGGSGEDVAGSVDIDANYNIYLAGRTTSQDFPLVNPLDSTTDNLSDVFVTKIALAGPPFMGLLAGTVIDSFSSDPIEGAFVTVYRNGIQVSSDSSDGSGRYVINNLLGGIYYLECSKPDYINETIPNIQIFGNETTEVSFQLQPNGPPPCFYFPGDANGDSIFSGLDISYAVNYLMGLGMIPPESCICPSYGILRAAADANGSCEFNCIDITYMVLFLKFQVSSLLYCVDCPPATFNSLTRGVDLKLVPRLFDPVKDLDKNTK